MNRDRVTVAPDGHLRVRIKVRDAYGTYTATLGKHRASATGSAEFAVQRVADKYFWGSGLRRAFPICVSRPEHGVEIWEIEVWK
jgi:hypothetical protein